MPVFLLRRANYRALAGDAGADSDARQVLAQPKWKEHYKAADGLLKWMAARQASGDAAIFALLIPANRLAAQKRWDEAAKALETLRREHPDDPQVRYRIAALQFARGNVDGAASAFTSIAADRRTPAWVAAQSWLYVARAHDLAGRRTEARRMYQRVVDDYERESAAWAARVGLITPYQRR